MTDTRFYVNNKKQINKKYERIDIKKLEDVTIIKEYQKQIKEKLDSRGGENDLKKQWTTIKESILKSAEDVCGKRKVNNIRKGTRWWNEDVKAVIKKKKDAWKTANNKNGRKQTRIH